MRRPRSGRDVAERWRPRLTLTALSSYACRHRSQCSSGGRQAARTGRTPNPAPPDQRPAGHFGSHALGHDTCVHSCTPPVRGCSLVASRGEHASGLCALSADHVLSAVECGESNANGPPVCAAVSALPEGWYISYHVRVPRRVAACARGRSADRRGAGRGLPDLLATVKGAAAGQHTTVVRYVFLCSMTHDHVSSFTVVTVHTVINFISTYHDQILPYGSYQ